MTSVELFKSDVWIYSWQTRKDQLTQLEVSFRETNKSQSCKITTIAALTKRSAVPPHLLFARARPNTEIMNL